MEALNPLRSVHGRGSQTTRARALEFVTAGEFTKEEFQEHLDVSRRTADRILDEAVRDGVLAEDDDVYDLEDERRVQQYIATIRHLLMQHMESEFSGSMLDCHEAATEMIEQRWTRVPDVTPIDVDAEPRRAAMLVQALQDV